MSLLSDLTNANLSHTTKKIIPGCTWIGGSGSNPYVIGDGEFEPIPVEVSDPFEGKIRVISSVESRFTPPSIGSYSFKNTNLGWGLEESWCAIGNFVKIFDENVKVGKLVVSGPFENKILGSGLEKSGENAKIVDGKLVVNGPFENKILGSGLEKSGENAKVYKYWTANNLQLQVTANGRELFPGQSSELGPYDREPFTGQRSELDPYENISYRLQQMGAFKDFFDQLELTPLGRCRAMRELIRIGYEENGEQFDATLKSLSQNLGLSVTFTQEDMVVPHAHCRPLYVTAKLNNKIFPRTLVDGGSTINVMPRSTFIKAGISHDGFVKEEHGVMGVSGTGKAVGHVIANLQVGEIKSGTRFFVMDTNSVFDLILGREWIHEHHGIPSTLHQCLKCRFQGKEVVIKASQNPFESHEMDLPDAYLYK